jgi:hypothetical protein
MCSISRCPADEMWNRGELVWDAGCGQIQLYLFVGVIPTYALPVGEKLMQERS